MNITPTSIALALEALKQQTQNPLTSSAFDGILAARTNLLSTTNVTSTAALSGIGGAAGILPTGRNMALADPESAYRMMSAINNADVIYKAQFSELSQMKDYVAQMQSAGQSLGNITPSSDNSDIKSSLQGFITQYNGWVQRFSPDMQNGGVLAGTQAAQVSRHELEQSIKNIFNGAASGVHGLADLGVSINSSSGLASLDSSKLQSLLAGNKQGAVSALQEFSANFAKSASLLNSSGNFIPSQLDNLNRAIHYISDNSQSLQAEFGSGDAAQPGDQVAQALAAYNRAYGA